MAPPSIDANAVLRELAQLRDETARARGETKGVREEVRLGLERLAATWAEDAKARHALSGALTKLAETTKSHGDDLQALKVRELEDDHEKTRAKTAVTIFRVAGGAILGTLLSVGGYLIRSYIEVRDATRDHSAAIVTMHEQAERMEAARVETEAEVQEHEGAVIQVRTRLDNIDATLNRIEGNLERRRR